jgi:hypothetical protein
VTIRNLLTSALIILGIVTAMTWIFDGHIDWDNVFRTSAIAFAVALVFRVTQRRRTQS